MLQDLKIKRSRAWVTALIFSLFIAFSCDKDDDDGANTIIEATIPLDTKQEIPTVMNRNETGTAKLKLNADTTLTFNLSVSNLDATDPLTVAHIHTGGPVDVGSPVIPLVDNSTIKFQGNSASGTVKLNASQFNSVKDLGELYVNIHSTKLPLGLVRGQINREITFAQNVDLTPISSPLRPETGNAILRMSRDSTLFYKVTVNNLTQGDELSAAQISVGATGVSGPSIIPLYTTAAEYGTAKSVKLNASQANFLMNSQIYITVASQQVPELIRGQIR